MRLKNVNVDVANFFIDRIQPTVFNYFETLLYIHIK